MGFIMCVVQYSKFPRFHRVYGSTLRVSWVSSYLWLNIARFLGFIISMVQHSALHRSYRSMAQHCAFPGFQHICGSTFRVTSFTQIYGSTLRVSWVSSYLWLNIARFLGFIISTVQHSALHRSRRLGVCFPPLLYLTTSVVHCSYSSKCLCSIVPVIHRVYGPTLLCPSLSTVHHPHGPLCMWSAVSMVHCSDSSLCP